MKRWKQIFFVLVMGIVMCLVTQRTCAAEPYEKITNANEWELLKLVNKERLKEGRNPLTIFASLQSAAGVRAKEIAEEFSHNRPDGRRCFTVLDEKGIDYSSAGENIAAGQLDPSSVMSAWMNSQGHRNNILSNSYGHIGVGYATGGDYGRNWVQMFIGGCSVESIAIEGEKTDTYAVGTSIEKMNRYLSVKCSTHGTSYVPVTDAMCKGYAKDEAGRQTITVILGEKRAKFSVTLGDGTSKEADTVKKPAKIKNLKVTKKTKTTVSLKWGKRSSTGYEVWMARSKDGTYKKVKTITSAKNTSVKIKKLKSGKKYYFKVRAYKKENNKKIYGAFSKAVVVKTK